MKQFMFTNTIKNQLNMSKKLLLLLITLTTFTNVSYASFPVTETQQTEVVEKIKTNALELPRKNYSWIYGVLSILLLLLALSSVFIIYMGMITMSLSGPAIANFIAVAIYSFIAAIVLGIIAIVKK